MSKHRTHGTIRRRLLSGVLCLALLLGLLPPGTVLPARAANWADPYGQQLVQWGVMRGDISGNLNLDAPITRAEFVTMCNRAFGYTKLGAMPFTDVPSYQWYAQDINIAYNAGYFKGTSATQASPLSVLTREQAAVLLARNLMLREGTGESLGFSDSRTLNEWSRGLIAAAVAEGMLNGYSDGTFRPFNNITRGEVAAMLVRVIGTPVNKAGDYSFGDVYGNMVISSSNVTLRDTTVLGNLYLTGGIDLGNVLLENVTVLGRIVVAGAGESNASQSSVVLRNVGADEMVVDSMTDRFVTIRAQGVTDIPLTSVRASAYLDDSSWPGYGLRRIELDGEPGAKLQLAGSLKEVVNLTPSSDLQLVQGSAEKVTIDEYARNSQVLVDIGTRIDELNLDVATLVTGDGDIKDLNIGAAGSEVDILPDSVTIRPGITATIAGVEMGSAAASELSSEPRLMAGYPGVTNISPTGAEGLFSGNKPGTIYWAVSALSDGSVSEADLISNPTYGGNIFAKQAGSISASAKTEYGREIKDLLPDGSYYISAIMVDGRGKRSPLKVAAFTTPDDTKPAFTTDPVMSRKTTTVAQVTAMANKNCLMYWAVLPEGSSEPTPQEFKSGSISGNWGYGSISVVKNSSISVNVNRVKLREDTGYDVYLWLTDHNGAQSMDKPFKLSFRTPDETAPVVGPVNQTAYGDDTAGVTFSINEAPSTLYWAVVAQGDTSFMNYSDLSDRRAKIKVESGKDAGALVSGSKEAAGANVDTVFEIAQLVYDTYKTNNFTLYYVAKDAAGNYSDKVESITIRTNDRIPPTVTQEFSPTSGGQPLAGSSVTLVFSENVQSGNDTNNVKIFKDLYEAVKAAEAAGNVGNLQNARDNLAAALRECITLYTVPRDTNQPRPVTERTDDVDDSDYVPSQSWTIDWRFAEVNMQSTDRLEIYLPAASSDSSYPNHTAIQMQSGVTYYFHTEGIYDTALTPNPLESEKNSGQYDLPTFRTVYAQVNIAPNGNCVSIPASETLEDDQKDLRLDICFEVTPQSTSKVPDSERWDLILMTDTWVEMTLYRQEWDENGKLLDTDGNEVTRDATTSLVSAETWKGLGSVTMLSPAGKEYFARGMGYSLLGNSAANGSYGVLRDDLKEGHTYRYGVHFTEFKGTGEGTSTKTDPPTWDGTVRMKVALIAGDITSVRNVSQRANDIYSLSADGDMGGNAVSVISQWNSQTGPEKELLMNRPYTDTRVPEFYTDYPRFTMTSGSVNMDLRLTRGGTIYYVIAPASVVSPSVPYITASGGSSVFNITDAVNGSTLDSKKTDTADAIDEKKTAILALPNNDALTYIPLSGAEREYFKDCIAFTSFDATSADADDGKTATVYTVPTFDDVRTPSNAGYDKISTIKSGSKVLGTAAEDELVSGLMAETEYYVFFVFQGGGDPGKVVECYRFTTPEAKAPVVNITGNSYTALTINTINVEDGKPYTDTTIYYALAVMSGSTGLGALPEIFNTEYFWSENGVPVNDSNKSSTTLGPKYTVLEAMSTPVSGQGGKTYFDLYGDVDGIKLKDRVRQYITDAQSASTGLGTAPLQQLKAEGPSKYQDFSGWMTSDSAEYIVLTAAKQTNASDDSDSYGFSVARGLYNPKTAPPELRTAPLMTNGRQMFKVATFTKVCDTEGNDVTNSAWGTKDDAPAYSFSGTLTIIFSDPVYQVLQSGTFVRKAVVAASSAKDSTKQISVMDFVTTSGGNWTALGSDTENAASVFTFKFEDIKSGAQLIFPTTGSIGGSNPGGDVNTKVLTLTFDAGLINKDYGGYTERLEPGFTWTYG